MTEERIQKAWRLVDDRRVNVLVSNAHGSTAVVHGDHGEYQTLVYPDGTFACGCTWGAVHNDTANRCSHAMALQIVLDKGAHRKP